MILAACRASPPSPETKQETEDQQAPLYNVVLLDDDEHTYEYVVEMLEKLFAFSDGDAWNHAVEVDTTGRTVVHDLRAASRPSSAGIRSTLSAPTGGCRSRKGSMSAIVEPSQV